MIKKKNTREENYLFAINYFIQMWILIIYIDDLYTFFLMNFKRKDIHVKVKYKKMEFTQFLINVCFISINTHIQEIQDIHLPFSQSK